MKEVLAKLQSEAFERRLLGALVAAAALAVFSPALSGGFLYWDDVEFIIRNKERLGFWPSQLWWAWTTPTMGHYHPLTWMSLSLDKVLWGLEPAGFHATNVLLHAAAAVLFYILALTLLPLIKERARAAAFAALFFALHPLRVESVAWITERRDVLCAVFYLAALLCHVRGRSRARLGFFAAALLSKASAISLPVVLLAIDYYRLGRLDKTGWRTVLKDKIPLFALAAAATAITVATESAVGWIPSLAQSGLGARSLRAADSAAFYLVKTVLPVRLQPYYAPPSLPVLILGAALFSAAAAAAVYWGRRRLAIAAVAVAYLAAFLPSSGMVGRQVTADRYSYLPALPIALLLAGWAAGKLSRRRETKLFAAIALALGALSAWRCRAWHDDESLWVDAVAADPANATARNNLAFELARQGRDAEALVQAQAALVVDPDFVPALGNAGALLARAGRFPEAETLLRRAAWLAPADGGAAARLAQALSRAGRPEEAVPFYWRAIALADSVALRYDLGNALGKLGREGPAMEQYRAAIRMDPSFGDARVNLGLALSDRGKFAEAAAEYKEALKLSPRPALAHYDWGNALAADGRQEEAARHYREAARLDPGLVDARFNLANALVRLGRLRQAKAEYQKVLAADPRYTAASANLSELSRLGVR